MLKKARFVNCKICGNLTEPVEKKQFVVAKEKLEN